MSTHTFITIVAWIFLILFGTGFLLALIDHIRLPKGVTWNPQKTWTAVVIILVTLWWLLCN